MPRRQTLHHPGLLLPRSHHQRPGHRTARPDRARVIRQHHRRGEGAEPARLAAANKIERAVEDAKNGEGEEQDGEDQGQRRQQDGEVLRRVRVRPGGLQGQLLLGVLPRVPRDLPQRVVGQERRVVRA